MTSRRNLLQHSTAVATLLAAQGLLPSPARAQSAPAHAKGAFDAKSLADVAKSLGLSAPVESKDVTLTGPDIAENGAVVPLAVASAAAGVKQLMLLVEKNPNALAALFNVGPDIDANVSTRVKMGQSSNVYGVAVMNDGKLLFAQKEVKVTLGGCGG
jgi:sulfur-oxidizing protein SoxY